MQIKSSAHVLTENNANNVALLMAFVITSHLRQAPQCLRLSEPRSVLHKLYTELLYIYTYLFHLGPHTRPEHSR